MKAAVVIGASGFIGTRLVTRLAAGGRFDLVRAVDIAPPRRAAAGVEYHEADVREDLPLELGQGAQVIYNLAAIHRTPGHPDHEYYDTNIGGALKATGLAEACGVETIVFTSSISVYGPSDDLMTESSPLSPVSAYGRSKRLAEEIHRRWQAGGDGRRLVIARPGVVFGPGERGNYTSLARALKRGLFAYPGRRDVIKSGGYVDDLLGAFDFALDRRDPSILFNFAYPEASTTQDIVRALSAVLGRPDRYPTLPPGLMLAGALPFEGLAKLGLPTPIHRERVLKLFQSTRISPGWLEAERYPFAHDLNSALRSWADETDGQFD